MNPVATARWRFPGGVRLRQHKTVSTGAPIADIPLPSQLVLPLAQHCDDPAEPVVEIGEQVARGQLVARPASATGLPVHASLAGRVTDITQASTGDPAGPAIVIAPDATQAPGAGTGEADWRTLAPEAICQRVRDAGIAGLGGAAFPTHIKLAAHEARPVHTLILNGAECEPWITCDQVLMQTRPEDILSGARIMARATGATRCLIAIEDHQHEALQAMQTALEALPGEDCEFSLVRVPTVYPEGGEKQLVQILTGQEVPSGGLPLDIGLLCHNVGTAAAVHEAICLGRPLLSRIVTVTGDCVARPGNFRVPLGTPVAELIAAAGGYLPGAERLIMGGSMMGVALASDGVPVDKGTDCILVLGGGRLARDDAAMPCIRCGECVEACPASLLPQQLLWHAQAGDSGQLRTHGLFDCIECGCCAVVCPSHIPLVKHYREAKTALWLEDYEQQLAEEARKRFETRQHRLTHEQQQHQAELEARKPLSGEQPDRDMAKAAIRAARERSRQRRRQGKDGGPQQGQD